MVTTNGKWMALVVAMMTLTACSETAGPKEGAGTLVGAAVGGLIGSQIGGSAGARIAAGLAGAAIGGLIGNRIGAALDEEDQRALAQLTRQSLETGSVRYYTSRRTGVKVSTRVVSTRTSSTGQLCRTVQQEVVLQNGQVAKDQVSGCRGREGWVV